MSYCGAKTVSTGKPCKRAAGAGTSHPGRGRCSKHGGSTPMQIRKNAREAVYEFVHGQMGYTEKIDPLDAAMFAVECAVGAVHYWRLQMAEAYRDGGHPSPSVVEGYRIAFIDLARMTDLASKAGVAERLIAITEAWSDRLTTVFEDALRGENIPKDQRQRMVQRYGAGLLQLEAGPSADALDAA